MGWARSDASMSVTMFPTHMQVLANHKFESKGDVTYNNTHQLHIDLTQFNSIVVESSYGWTSATSYTSSGSVNNTIRVICTQNTTTLSSNIIQNATTASKSYGKQTITLDVANATGFYSLAIQARMYDWYTTGYTYSSQLDITSIYLTK